MSRKNQDTWKFARRHWGTLNFRLGILLPAIFPTKRALAPPDFYPGLDAGLWAENLHHMDRPQQVQKLCSKRPMTLFQAPLKKAHGAVSSDFPALLAGARNGAMGHPFI